MPCGIAQKLTIAICPHNQKVYRIIIILIQYFQIIHLKRTAILNTTEHSVLSTVFIDRYVLKANEKAQIFAITAAYSPYSIIKSNPVTIPAKGASFALMSPSRKSSMPPAKEISTLVLRIDETSANFAMGSESAFM